MTARSFALPIAVGDAPRLVRDAVQASGGGLRIARMSRSGVDVLVVGGGGTVVKLTYRADDDGGTRFETSAAVTAVLMGDAPRTDADELVDALEAVGRRWRSA